MSFHFTNRIRTKQPAVAAVLDWTLPRTLYEVQRIELPVRVFTVSPMGITYGYAIVRADAVVATLVSTVSSQWDSVLIPSFDLSFIRAKPVSAETTPVAKDLLEVVDLRRVLRLRLVFFRNTMVLFNIGHNPLKVYV